MAVTDASLLSQNLCLALLCRNQFPLLCKKKVFHLLCVIPEAADKWCSSAIDAEPTCSESWSEMAKAELTDPCRGTVPAGAQLWGQGQDRGQPLVLI